ncbi:MAG: hypothetical protein FVQ79_04800, partial [Planctomycetes bacterium]|nr:hypothetical protein [Planctomycetota bacterium]
TAIGHRIGLVDDERWNRFNTKIKKLADLEKYLKSTREAGLTLWHQLKQTGNPLADNLADEKNIKEMQLSSDVLAAAAIDARYEGYLKRQIRQIESFRKLENVKLPENIDYNAIKHLSNEAKAKLSEFRPDTLAQAGRIGGITPADINVLQIELQKARNS